MPNSSTGPDFLPVTSDPDRGRLLLARKWAYLLSGVIVVPLTRQDLESELSRLLDVFCGALAGEPTNAASARQVGEELVALGYVGEQGLKCTMDVLGKGLLALPEFRPADHFAERVVLGLGSLACGFLAAHERGVLDQQEMMHLSLLKAVRDAQWNLEESEARFEEVVTSSASGVVLVDVTGKIVRANAAICGMLGYTAGELTGKELVQLVHPDSADVLRQSMRALVEGRKDRVRQPQRLVRKDGELARISLTASLLRDADDKPSHFVTVIEDGTELMLLQSELSRQALHDVLTGLPNRQFFSTHLEGALRRADPAYGVTLFHLDLDAFGMVCNSLGRRAGERLLVHFAQRLRMVMAREKAMIARFHADEFGILVENSPGTPDIGELVANINDELAEPFFVDGHGLGISVSVGVVHRPSPTVDPLELLRAADQTLRRAKNQRRGQWQLFDPAADAEEQRAQAVAVGMPGAWESGEIGVRYRPVVRLADETIAGVEGLLSWERPGGEVVPHDRCAELAEPTGLILPLGEWLLRVATRQGEWWRQRVGFGLPLVVGLTAHQVSDAAMVARVARVLDDTGLPPEQVQLGVPVGALGVEGAVQTLHALAKLGVQPMLDDFGLGPDDLRIADELRVRTVRVARRLVEWQTRSHSTFLADLVPLIGATGAMIVVDGIDTPEQAAWWRDAGADLATGAYLGVTGEAGDLVERL